MSRREWDPYEGDPQPCPRCLLAFADGHIRRECVQPLPPDGIAPLAVDGSGPCCHDCQAADNLLKMFHRGAMPPGRWSWAMRDVPIGQGMTWGMARTCVGNDRQSQYRLPGIPMGLCHPSIALMQPSRAGDLDRHHAWLDVVLPMEDETWCDP